MIRVETTPNGAFNVTEFGTVKDPAQFQALLAYSPYHHVVDGTRYPAVLLTAGEGDPRVDSWHAKKMAARLQEATASGPAGRPPTVRMGARHRDLARRGASPRAADLWTFFFAELGVPFQPGRRGRRRGDAQRRDERRVPLRSRATGALCAGTVAAYAAMYVTQPLLPMLSAEFAHRAGHRGTLGLGGGARHRGRVLPGRAALRRAGRKKAVMVGPSPCSSCPRWPAPLARTFPQLVALRAVQGFLIPGVTAVAVAWAGDHYAPGQLRAVGGRGHRRQRRRAACWGAWRAASWPSRGAGARPSSSPRWSPRRAPSGWGWSCRGVGSPAPPGAVPWAGMLRHLRDRRLLGGFALAFCLFFAFIADLHLPALPAGGAAVPALHGRHRVGLPGLRGRHRGLARWRDVSPRGWRRSGSCWPGSPSPRRASR